MLQSALLLDFSSLLRKKGKRLRIAFPPKNRRKSPLSPNDVVKCGKHAHQKSKRNIKIGPIAVSNDSVIKCPFCDSPFISKGAYRHHLSKMHFTKESSAVPVSNPNEVPSALRTPSPEAKEDETLQSKYHKY